MIGIKIVYDDSQDRDSLIEKLKACLKQIPEDLWPICEVCTSTVSTISLGRPIVERVEVSTSLNKGTLEDVIRVANVFLPQFRIHAYSPRGPMVERNCGEGHFTVHNWIYQPSPRVPLDHFFCPHCGARVEREDHKLAWRPTSCRVCATANKKLVAGEPRFCCRCAQPFVPNTGSGVGDTLKRVCPECD
ncbi:MAG: hypothetical protein NTZ65_00060 [Candidatus Berkelbacteria bacterium]|nr:hypothetical protein [Candidatus Berkelbacteria bacterium]